MCQSAVLSAVVERRREQWDRSTEQDLSHVRFQEEREYGRWTAERC